MSLHPAKLCCYSQHFAGPVWVACCSAVLDSPTNGTCSCVLLPQLLGTLDKETMLPCTDRGSAHNQTNVPLVLSVAQCSARNNAVVSATAGWLNQWGTSWSRSRSVFAPSLANSAMRRGWLIRLPVNANGVGRVVRPVPPPVRHFSSTHPGLFAAGGGGGNDIDETVPPGEPALCFLWLFSELHPQQPAASARVLGPANVQHPSRRSPAMSLQRTPRNVSARAKR